MPKCPFCGSSQSNGEKLSIHLYSKHRDQEHIFERTATVRHTSRKRSKIKYVVLDGNNIAYANGNPPQARLIKSARNYIKKRGYEPIIIISAALRHKVEDQLELIRMINISWVIEAEPHSDDDRLVIDTALNKHCKIITNDRFLDHLEYYNESSVDIRTMLVKFKIIDNKFSL